MLFRSAPLGPVYQAGTLSGNPVAVAAGLATLKLISAPGFFDRLTAMTAQLMQDLQSIARECGEENFCTDSVGGMFGIYFSKSPPVTFEDVNTSNRDQFNRFFHAMLKRGVYLAPNGFEVGFLSLAHTPDILQAAAKALSEAAREVGAH